MDETVLRRNVWYTVLTFFVVCSTRPNGRVIELSSCRMIKDTFLFLVRRFVRRLKAYLRKIEIIFIFLPSLFTSHSKCFKLFLPRTVSPPFKGQMNLIKITEMRFCYIWAFDFNEKIPFLFTKRVAGAFDLPFSSSIFQIQSFGSPVLFGLSLCGFLLWNF